MRRKRKNPKHKPRHFSSLIRWSSINKAHPKDNYVRKYSEVRSLEELLKTEIERCRDEWRKPYTLYEDENQVLQKDYDPPLTIREKLELPDAGFRHSAWKYHFSNWCTWVRVPSLKRSNTEWENFYRTFPSIAVKVALGNERFCDGAKLKYIPLFKKTLDEVWPENLTRWTEFQYQDLIMRGRIKD